MTPPAGRSEAPWRGRSPSWAEARLWVLACPLSLAPGSLSVVGDGLRAEKETRMMSTTKAKRTMLVEPEVVPTDDLTPLDYEPWAFADAA